MTWTVLLFLYVAGMVLTVVVLFTCVFVAIKYRVLSEKLPEAVHWANLTKILEEAKEDYERMKQERHDAEKLIEQAESAKKFLEESEERIQSYERQVAELQDLEAKIANLIEEKARLEDKLQELSNLESQLANKCESLQKQYDNLALTVEQLEKGRESIEEENKESRKLLTKLQSELAQSEVALSNAKAQVEQAIESLEKLRAIESNLEEHTTKLREELDSTQREHARLNAECSGLEEHIKSHEDRIERLKKDIDLYAEERSQVRPASQSTAEERLSALWEPMIDVQDLETAISSADEQQCLQSTKTYIRDSGLVFPDRVIDALHTSFKVANEAPLLVIAGISGTGKSALPRSYAEGMGIHFLSIPVQPSWDSPMDLLGFYNHLEGHFKPTPLSRALIQFDPHYEAEGRNWPLPEGWEHSLNSRLLMVLLDEMNLARIEYYFSEFLSKLETRRDVDPQNSIDRQKAEILLETGGRQAEHQVIPLFVDTNVLFVGTMNEDESTVSLSDKVIDRANIMRFGKPKEFQTQDPNRSRKRSSKSHLAWNDWKRWISQEREDGLWAEDARHWIHQCNEALAKIAKPFAHRTSNSILAYIRQYPDKSETGARLAMADQIEQRIMPKLRGVDAMDPQASSSLNMIVRLARDLGDEDLVRAIEEGRSAQSGHYFMWMGVDRPVEEVAGATA